MARIDTEGPEDSSLLRRIQDGDAEAVGALYDRYGGIAFGVARRVVGDAGAAEDVVQESFLALWRYAPRFDGTRGSVRTWLLSIVHNKAVDVTRRRSFRSESALPEAAEEIFADEICTEAMVEQAFDGAAVRRALAEVPDEQRRVVELVYFGGLTHVEAAEQLAIPVGTVKSRLRLALEKLRESLAAKVKG